MRTQAETKGKGGRFFRDLIELSKPGIVRMCAITSAGGLWLAPGTKSANVWIAGIVGSSLVVAGANAFNMVWERHSDLLMRRTSQRPVATGRLSVRAANLFGVVTSALGLILLATQCNWLSAALAAFALASYVLIYTPLKRRTPLALVIGAIPGAVPPLLGWTCATGGLEVPGWVLFGILMVWQMPHFIAIALYRKDDYGRAGIRTVPIVRGDRVAKIQAMAWAALLLPVSLGLTLLEVTGTLYLVVATILGVGFLGWSATGLREDAGALWARRFFFASLIYLPALILALILDVGL
jgi:protoheme IX farnesyltransferase